MQANLTDSRATARANRSLADSRPWRRGPTPGCPHQFRALCEGLVIRVEDFPTEEVLTA